MAIQERVMRTLLEFKIHIAFAVALVAAVLALVSVGPSLAAVLGFFWPLLVSTGFFLLAMAILLRISPSTPDSSYGATGEDLIDYVAGRSEDVQLGADELELGASGADDDGDGGSREQQRRSEEAEHHPQPQPQPKKKSAAVSVTSLK